MKDFPDAPEKTEQFEPFEKEREFNDSGYYLHDRGDYVEAIHCRQGHHKPEQLWSR